MGAFEPLNVLPVLSGFVRTFNTIDRTFGVLRTLTGADDDLKRDQLSEKQRLEQAQLAQNIGLQKEQLATQSAQDEQKRRTALRRAVSRQRANFGAQGVNAGEGSAEAVLLGLFDESEEERAQREQLDNLRRRALDMEYAQQGALNLLQATQLAQKQKMQRFF